MAVKSKCIFVSFLNSVLLMFCAVSRQGICENIPHRNNEWSLHAINGERSHVVVAERTKELVFNFTLHNDIENLKMFASSSNVRIVAVENSQLLTIPSEMSTSINVSVRGMFIGRAQILFHVNKSMTGVTRSSTTWVKNDNSDWYDLPFAVDVAVKRPIGVLNRIFTGVVIVLVCLANVAMGCKTDIMVVKETLRKPIAPVTGLCSQFILMPLISFAVGRALNLEAALAFGLFATGCSPGGAASNIYTYFLDGNVSLSVTMTFVSTLVAVDMDGFPELKSIVDSFEDFRQLREFADVTGIWSDSYVKEKILELTKKAVDKKLQLPCNDTTTPIFDVPKIDCHAVPMEIDYGSEPMEVEYGGPEVSQYGGQVTSPQPGPSNDNKPYNLQKISEKRFKTVAATDSKYRVKLDRDHWQNKQLKNIHADLHDLFETVLNEVREKQNENDVARVLIHHPSLNNDIVIPLRPLHLLNAEVVMEHIEKVLQSHEDLPITDGFEIDVGVINVPKGSGRKKITSILGVNNSIKSKTSLVQIVNDDTLCMARSIAVCWARINQVTAEEWQHMTENDSPFSSLMTKVLKQRKVPTSYYKHLINKNRNEQRDLAITLCKLANIPTDRPLGLNDIESFEDLLDVNILVVSARLGNKFVKVTDSTDRKNLYLYLVEDAHFHAITNISGFFSSSYFCETCLKPYSNREYHSCVVKCIVCKQDGCLETDTQMTCIKCHMTCRSMVCLLRHKESPKYTTGEMKGQPCGPSECQKWWKCPTCHKVLKTSERKPEKHRCGEYRCTGCAQYVMADHRCYLRALPPSDDGQPKFVFFDFECTQDQILQCEEAYQPLKLPNCETCQQKGNTCISCTRCRNCFNSWCGKAEHRPNFAVAHTVCKRCINKPLTPESKCHFCGTRCLLCQDPKRKKSPCASTCGFREKVFQGNDTAIKFGSWLFTEHFKNFTAVAHNMKGYDGYFILEYLIDQSMRPQKIIYNGSKIMYLQVGKGLNIKVMDSLNFLPMKLSALPKSFGLNELKKGWFPHFFNLQQNQHYLGLYPPSSFYGCNYMNDKERSEFLQWYDGIKHQTFDFRKEMLEYCRSDVDILRQACLKFRELLLNATGDRRDIVNDRGEVEVKYVGGVDPFDYVTIASVCMGIYKTKFMEETWRVKVKDGAEISDWLDAKSMNGKLRINYDGKWVGVTDLGPKTVHEKQFIKSPIAQVPTDGYGRKDQYSKVSIQWLEWLMHKENINIQHALNGGEKRIEGTHYSLDGYCESNNTVYEFHGCVFHGCSDCYPQDRDKIKHPRTSQSMEELHALTLRKKSYIKSLGMKYVCIWEHEFTEQIKSNTDIKSFVESLELVERLNPRDSFFGGRTNASKLHYKVQDAEQIKYVDFTSLYPWVNKYCQYPLGHPEMVNSDFKNLDQYFGIAQVKVLPPRGLYHPVLPYRSNGKLKFPLCRTCADNENQQPCNCTDEDRAITGTWCTPELQMAVNKGYKILKVYEIYHWKDTTQYDPGTGEGGLFASYINTFLKFKQEASGWPDWVKIPDDAKRYIENYFEKEGIKLEWDKIQKNPGLRALAKLCLNSFWGKFGQRLNMRQSDFIHDSEAEKFFQMLSDPTKEMYNFHITADDMIQLEWQHKNAFVPMDDKTNIYLASFTTCWARLKLYDVLDHVGERVLYYDTDSVIYVSKPGEFDPPLGDYLGELTNELDGDEYIVEFISGGPKNYSYRTNTGKETCKVRGFSLNFTNSKLINFDAMKDIVTGPQHHVTVTNPSKISRDKTKRKLYNTQEQKKYQMVYTKRVVLPNMDTVPYGY